MIKSEQKQQVLQARHNDPVSGAHFGRDKVYIYIYNIYIYIYSAKKLLVVLTTEWLPGCRQAEETVVMRSVFGYQRLSR